MQALKIFLLDIGTWNFVRQGRTSLLVSYEYFQEDCEPISFQTKNNGGNGLGMQNSKSQGEKKHFHPQFITFRVVSFLVPKKKNFSITCHFSLSSPPPLPNSPNICGWNRAIPNLVIASKNAPVPVRSLKLTKVEHGLVLTWMNIKNILSTWGWLFSALTQAGWE